MISNDDSVHLAFGFDALMELPFLVVAHSIRRRLKPGRKAVFHVLHTEPLHHCATYLDRAPSDTCEFRFYRVENPMSGMRMRNGLTSATYLRFLLPDLLAGIDRVIWLDCDLAVLRDISELYDMSLDGLALAAAPDESIAVAHTLNGWPIGDAPNIWPAEQYFQQVIGLSGSGDYFNSGVLVIDLDAFRKQDMVGTCRDFLSRTETVRIFNDQDALNHAINGAFKRLDQRWNVQAGRTLRDYAGAQSTLADAAREWQSDPWILHYTGTGKPWLANMTGTIRDRAYWREALSCPMLPELIDLYLASCDRAQLTHLFSSRDLLALGKPRLDEDALRDGVDALGADTSSAMAALVERLDVWPGLRAASVPVGRFRRYQGEHRDEELAFELAGMDGHLVYGPYACYPRGSYAATFDFTLEQCEPWPTGRLVIEVGFGSEFKAQHILDAKSDLGEVARTLMFDLDGEELSVEFRVFASGFARGRLRFGGVQLQRRLSKSEDRRPPRWRSVLARMGFG